MQSYTIAPSLLSADFSRLGDDAQAVLDAGADILHLDVMDNHYVPNLTVGPLVCAALRKYGIKAPIDVHLMVTPVDSLITDFAEAGATNITFHPDASTHVDRSLDLIRKLGCKAGLSLNPATTLDCLEYVMDKLDLILIMSVNPGFGGQSFIPSALTKIKRAHEIIKASGKQIDIAVDGGVKTDNIGEIAKAGANMFIAGSAIFGQPDYKTVIAAMRAQIKSAAG
ncbi:MAG TPA: ribulose-phosphate 3-epimerase [Gammaproteobacteria bacterium]|nr:ribulose-phosphate 3-epimerase [Gammaproteobacteria bacterium]